jgi:hypothetical protein
MANRFQRLVRRLSARREIVCIGHSHVDSVAAAAAAAGIPLEAINFWHTLPFCADGSVELTPEVCSRLIAPVFSFVGGAVHHEAGLFVHSRPYDFVLPEQQNLPLSERAELVPYDAVYASMQARTRPNLKTMGAIRVATRGRMFHMESPPIYSNEVAPTNIPGWMPDLKEYPPISPVWLRYKLWRVHSGIVRAYCREADIAFIPHPPEAADAQGLLAAEFYGATAHANREYGALVLRQIQELASDRAAARR